MTQQTDGNKHRVAALVSLGLLSLGAAVYYVNKNYDVRLVRADAAGPGLDMAPGSEGLMNTADSTQAAKSAPIVVRLACANAGSAMSSLKSPSRSLRQQLQQAGPKTPAPLANKRCKQSAGL